MALRILLFLLGTGLGSLAWAGGPISWVFASGPAGGDTVQVHLTATCEPGWHIYALTLPSDEGPLPTVVTVDPGQGYHLAGPAVEQEPEETDDPNFGMVVRYHGGTATFSQPTERDTQDAYTLHGSVEYMACNDKTCLPPRKVEFTLDIPSAK